MRPRCGQYIVRGRVDGRLFEALVGQIRTHGFAGRFYGHALTYFAEARSLYWTMGAETIRPGLESIAKRKTGDRVMQFALEAWELALRLLLPP